VDLASSLQCLNIEQRWDNRNGDMRKTTKVLSLGMEEWRDAVCEALPPRRKNGFWGVSNYWDLCALPQLCQWMSLFFITPLLRTTCVTPPSTFVGAGRMQ